jgi:bacterial/archaeal transporter family-2 protein
MPEQLLTILIGILGGIAVGVQTPIANSIGQRVGGTASSLVVHLSGAIASGLLLMMRGGENIQNLRTLPWWMFGVGIFGVVLYLTINHTIPRIGAATAITLIIVGQLVAGMVIDHFGLLGAAARPIDGTRIVAALMLLGGGYLMTR